jgi:hypothetical protein
MPKGKNKPNKIQDKQRQRFRVWSAGKGYYALERFELKLVKNARRGDSKEKWEPLPLEYHKPRFMAVRAGQAWVRKQQLKRYKKEAA